MAEELPKLLEVLQDIAKEYGYDENKINLKPISSKGANYTSRLFSITLSSAEKELKLFSKIATLGEQFRSMSETQMYEIEIIFYTNIYKKFADLENEHDLEYDDKLLLPKYYGGVKDYGKELMVLQDLTSEGFQSFDRFKCFDWEYASRCVAELAKFHALSVALQRNDPVEYAETIGKLKFSPSKESITEFFNKNIAKAVEATDEIYKERVKLFLRKEIKEDSFVKFVNPERKLLLCHGDFRPSNILHRVNGYGNLDIAMVDYQMIKQGNPVIDLIYFLICGSDEQFRTKYLQEYFNYYYERFTYSLELLGIEVESVYPEEVFREDVKEMLPFGLLLSTVCLLIVTVEEDNAPKPEECVDFDTFDIKPSDLFKVRFNGLVRDYVKLGIL